MKRLHTMAFATALIVSTLGAAAAPLDDLRAYRPKHEVEIVTLLDDLTRLKSIAADPEGLKATADRLQAELKARGFDTQQLLAAGSPPLVFGSLKTEGAKRTVVFYAHYDGQPVKPSEWKTDPFAPVMRSGLLAAPEVDWKSAKPPFDPEWRLYARAASDDKSSIVAFLAAIDALRASGRRPSVNIKVVWEGEEERGSPHLAQILHDNKELLKSDLWLIGDGPVHQSRTPTIYFGARGSVGMEATVYGPIRALHDGHYGNWVPNPAVMAARLIAALRNDDGAILIPGYAGDVRRLTRAERQAIAKLPPVEAALKSEFQVGRSEGREGLTASTMRPALNVRGFRAGNVGVEATNAIMTEAAISFDFRLVPNQTPERVREKVEKFLKRKGWTIVRDVPDAATRAAHPKLIRLSWESGYPALRGDMSSPAAKAVLKAAAAAANGPVAVLPMMGGSVPIYMFDETFNVPIIGLPIANHDNSQHAPNENLRLKNLWDGIDTYAALMSELAW